MAGILTVGQLTAGSAQEGCRSGNICKLPALASGGEGACSPVLMRPGDGPRECQRLPDCPDNVALSPDRLDKVAARGDAGELLSEAVHEDVESVIAGEVGAAPA